MLQSNTMDFSLFDKRGYPSVSARIGYREWAAHYEATVATGLDRPLLDELRSPDWANLTTAADLACGTGRTGVWLAQHGVMHIDGVDITPEMLELAKGKRVYRHLQVANAAATALRSFKYELCTMVLADEHQVELKPVYREAARLLYHRGNFVLVGYHPFFLMNGVPTHYHRPDGEAVTIESHIHLFSEHFQAGAEAGLILVEFRECVIDQRWLLTKPKWRDYLNWPVSFALVWKRR
jgi:SAM-dependent methyltransferase